MLAVNIPADGLFLAILHRTGGDLTPEGCREAIRAYMDRWLEAGPDIILLNVCYRRSLTPSDVFDSYLYDVETDENGFALRGEDGETLKRLSPVSRDVSKYFASFFTCARVLLEKGIDIYETAVERIRAAGCRVYLSLRMNDGHYPRDPAVNSAFAGKNGGIHTLARDGVSLDFSQAAVQNHFCEYIRELLAAYPVDGIELDWLRFPGVLPQHLQGDLSILSGYMQKIRGILDHHAPGMGLAVRVLPEEADNLQRGMDVCRWVAEGSTDMVTIENFYVPANYEMPVAHWKSRMEGQNVRKHPWRLFCGTDWAVSCVPGYSIAMTPALVRGFAADCLGKGADGVYLFNFFEENDTSAFEFVPYGAEGLLKNCFFSRVLAAREPEGLPRRYVHIGSSNDRYPIHLEPGQSCTFVREIQPPRGMCEIVIGTDEEVSLSVVANGSSLPVPERGERAADGFGFVPRDRIGKDNEFIYAVTQAANCVRRAGVPDGLMETGRLETTIRNDDSRPVSLLWLEISCRQAD